MLRNWWRERRQRRAAQDAAQDAARDTRVRERAFSIVRAVAEPLAVVGRAHLREVPDQHHGADDMWIEMSPLAEGAAEVAVNPDAWIVSVCVGREGNLHEILVGKNDGSWEAELRACLEAVVAGRYVERIDGGRIGDHLVMTFEGADGGDDVVVMYQSLGVERGAYRPYGERRFAPYVEPDDQLRD